MRDEKAKRANISWTIVLKLSVSEHAWGEIDEVSSGGVDPAVDDIGFIRVP